MSSKYQKTKERETIFRKENHILYVDHNKVFKGNEQTQDAETLKEHIMINTIKYSNKSLFEIICLIQTPFVKPFFDLDIKMKDNHIYEQQISQKKEILQNAIDFLKLNFDCSHEDIAISEASYPNNDKISYHLIIHTKKVKLTDLIKFHNDKKQDFIKLNFDLAVYRTYGKFRMIMTSKIGKKAPLLPLNSKDNISLHFVTNTENLPEYHILSNNAITNRIIKPKIKLNTIKHNESLDINIKPPILKSKLSKQNDRYNIENIKELIQLLSVDRSNNYTDWINLGLLLHNLNDKDDNLLSIWIDFSKKSSKFIEGECETLWGKLKSKDNGLTIGSLHYWAKNDNPIQYNEIKQKSMNNIILKSLTGTHIIMAKILYSLYGHLFKCTGTKTNSNWYMYNEKNYKWIECENAIYLKHKINQEIIPQYHIIINSLKDQIKLLNEKVDKDQINNSNKQIDKLNKIILNLENFSFRDRLIKTSQEFFYDPDFENKLDANAELLGFNNGVFDCKINRFRLGYPDDYITLSTGYDYKSYDDDAPEIVEIYKFLNDIFPDDDYRDYMINVLASCILGGNKHQHFYVLTGNGANGKSVLKDLLKLVFGQYLQNLNVSILTNTRTAPNQATPENAILKGARLAICNEPEKNAQINSGLMKEYTGEGYMRARPLYKEPIEFSILFKLFLICNDKPALSDDSEGSWRRTKVCPFINRFVEYEPKLQNERIRDNQINIKFERWKCAFMHILIEHFKLYKNRNFEIIEPEIIKNASKEYRKDNDELSSIFDEQIIKIDNPQTTDFFTLSEFMKILKSKKIKMTRAQLVNKIENTFNIKMKTRHYYTLNGQPKENTSVFFGYKLIDTCAV